jgi:hypothetical protein
VCSQFVSGSERTSPLRGAVLSSSRLKVEFPNLRWSGCEHYFFGDAHVFFFLFELRPTLRVVASCTSGLCVVLHKDGSVYQFFDARVRVVRVTGSSDAFLGA